MILCLGSAADPTFLHGLSALRRTREDVRAVDVVQMILSGGFVLDAADPLASHLDVGGDRYRFADVTGAWVRIPDLVHEGLDDETVRRTWSTTRALSATLAALASTGVPVVNPPSADLTGFSKPVHLLHMAARAGFRVPETCVTNVPERVRAFVAEHDGDVITKGVSSAKTWARAWDATIDEDRLDLVRATPIQLQRRVHGPDVRVHTVGHDLFAELIHSEDVDYRRVRGRSRFVATTCPPDVAAGCCALVDLTGAPLLGVDFKVDDRDGRWLFLEANTMPCFQGYDARAGGAIGSSLAHYVTHAAPVAVRS